MSGLLIAGGRVLDPAASDLDDPPVLDILIEDGRIAALGAEAAARGAAGGTPLLDATGMLVTPGFVNAHSHSHDALLRGCFEGLPLDVWGLFAFPAAWPKRTQDEIRDRTLLHAMECLRGGITTVQDMVSLQGPDRAQAEAVIAAYRESGIRALLGWQFGDRATADTLPFVTEELSHELLARLPQAVDPRPMQALVEALLPAAAGGLLGSVLAPSAPQRCSPDVLAWAAALSRERELPVCTHVYETRGQAVLARQAYGADGGSLIRYLERHGLLVPRLLIAHGVWIAEDEMAALGDAGAHLACNPAANLKLLNGAAPVRAYARRGVGLSLGSDNSSAGDAQSMFQAMRSFALHWSLQAAGPEDAAAAAFRAATLGGARALGLDGQVGALKTGYRADLALFDLSDPAWLPMNSAVRQLVYAESGRSLRTVVVDGRIVLRDGRLTTIAAAPLAAAIQARQSELQRSLTEMRDTRAALAVALGRADRRAAEVPLPFNRFNLQARE